MTLNDVLPLAWPDIARAFTRDGGLRDIVIRPSEMDDWQRAYDYVRVLVRDGEARAESDPDPLPETVADVFAIRDERWRWLKLFMGPMQINCHFFGELAVEFDVDPVSVATPAAAKQLLDFAQRLGDAVGRSVEVTDDDQPENVWFTYEPGTGLWAKGPRFSLTYDRPIVSYPGDGPLRRLKGWIMRRIK